MNNNFAYMGTDELLVKVNQATAEMMENNIQVVMTMDILDLLAAVGGIQLALRHPALPAFTREMLIRVVARVAIALSEYPALVELVHRGGNADYDITASEAHAFRLVRQGEPGQEQDFEGDPDDKR